MRQEVAEDLRQLTDWIVEGSAKVCNEAVLRGDTPPWEELMDMRLARRVRTRVEASQRSRDAYERAVRRGWRPKVPTEIEDIVYCFEEGTIHDASQECDSRHGKTYVWMEKE